MKAEFKIMFMVIPLIIFILVNDIMKSVYIIVDTPRLIAWFYLFAVCIIYAMLFRKQENEKTK